MSNTPTDKLKSRPGTDVPPLVEMRGIVKRFGDNIVLRDINFDIRPGEVHALLGGNGAGKSTLMKILMGVHRADRGEILLSGQPVAAADVGAAQQLGVAMIFQELSLLPNLTVAENIMFGREPRRVGFRIDRGAVNRMAREHLAAYGFSIPVTKLVESLPFAQRQVVEIVRAASFGARVLIMDEPTSALTSREEEKLFELMRSLTAQDIGIVYISHRMSEIMQVADRITVLRDGRTNQPIPVAEAELDKISEQMSGSAGPVDPHPVLTETPVAHVRSPADRPALQVGGLETARTLKTIDLTIMPGEIVGIAGLVGSGRSTLCKAIAGLLRDAKGQIEIGGQSVRAGQSHKVLGRGLGFVPEDRRLEGLVLDHRLDANVALPNLHRLGVGGQLGLVQRSQMSALFREAIQGLALVARGPDQYAAELSGGNQQKVVVGKWLASQPKVLILDEPTSGVDVRAKADMRAALQRAVRETGLAILLVNSELDEMLALCHRVLIMERGRLTQTAPSGIGVVELQALLLHSKDASLAEDALHG
jgi:ABC-type sugar transport system ATPase subunit